MPCITPRWQTFTLGTLTGAALALGAARLLAPTRPSAPTTPVASAPATGAIDPASTTASPAAPQPTGLNLHEKIARLHRWANGQDRALPDKDRWTWLMEWSEQEPYAALAFVEKAPRFPERNWGLVMPLVVIGREHPAEVVQWLRTHLPRTEDRVPVAEEVSMKLEDDFPAAALELAIAPDLSYGPYRLAQAFARIAATQPALAQASFLRLSVEQRTAVADGFLAAWSRVDTPAALAWTESQRGQPYFENCVRGLLQAAASQSAAELGELLRRLQPSVKQVRRLDIKEPTALAALLEYLPANARAAAFDSDIRQLMPSHPEALTELAQRYLSADQQVDFLAESFTTWLQSDRPAALAWMQTQSQPDLLRRLQRQLAEEQFSTNPQQYLAWLETQPGTETEQAQALGQMAYDYPAQAADWLLHHATPQAQSAAAIIMARYLQRDEAAAATWVARLPPGPLQDQALDVAANHWAETKEIAFATSSIHTISDPAQKTATQFSVFKTLHARDAATATQWAASQGLSPEIIANWQTLSPKSGSESDEETIRLDPFTVSDVPAKR